MSFDFDLVVIGAGPGGYTAACRASKLGLKTACIEKENNYGGTCLNIGCIPSKCLLHSSEVYDNIKNHSKAHGITATAELDFSKMMSRKDSVVNRLNNDIRTYFEQTGVERIVGLASFVTKNTISVNGKIISAKFFVIATGSVPISIPFLPFDEKSVLSSTGLLSIQKVPESMIIVGAGIIGVELGSVFSRLGTKVDFIESKSSICSVLDHDLSSSLEHILRIQGLSFHLNQTVIYACIKPERVALTLENGSIMEAEKVLVAVGRKPFTDGLSLDHLNIHFDPYGYIPVNSNYQTSCSNIFAVGDLVNGPMLAHSAFENGLD